MLSSPCSPAVHGLINRVCRYLRRDHHQGFGPRPTNRTCQSGHRRTFRGAHDGGPRVRPPSWAVFHPLPQALRANPTWARPRAFPCARHSRHRYGRRRVPGQAARRAGDHAHRDGGRGGRRAARGLPRAHRGRGPHGDGRTRARHGAARDPLRRPPGGRQPHLRLRPRGDPRRARQLSAAARRRRIRPVRGGPAVRRARRHQGRADRRVRSDRPGREHDLPHAAGARPEGEPQCARRVPGGGRRLAGLPRGDRLGRGDPDHGMAGRPTRSPRSSSA